MEFSIKLEEQELNQIGSALYQLPYKDVAPLIEKLKSQAAAQVIESTPAEVAPVVDDKKTKKLQKV
jgi:hypothetical protein